MQYLASFRIAVRDSLSALLTLNGFNVEMYASGVDFLNTYDWDCPGCLLIDFTFAANGRTGGAARIAQAQLPSSDNLHFWIWNAPGRNYRFKGRGSQFSE